MSDLNGSPPDSPGQNPPRGFLPMDPMTPTAPGNMFQGVDGRKSVSVAPLINRLNRPNTLSKWLKEYFDSPEGRLIIKSRMLSNDNVLLHCIDRAYGKVKQGIDLSMTTPLDELSDEQLMDLAKSEYKVEP